MSTFKKISAYQDRHCSSTSKWIQAPPVGASVVAMAVALAIGGVQTASAQTAAAPAGPATATASDGSGGETLEAVTVTGSRIARTGFTAPTPVTVIGADDINLGARPNIADLINTMPSVRASLTPTSTTNQSLVGSGNFIDLRGLGEVRTLTLVDGKRFVPANRYGDVDLNAIPQALVSSIDIVTGGASAAYGSNAVAGVVNLRLDHELEGFKGSVQGGGTDHDDHRNYVASLAYGTKFDDGRGRILLGGEIADNSGIGSLTDRDWGRQGWGIITNPAYTPTNSQPARLLVPGTTSANRTYGGVITSGPLKGIQFGPGGQPIPFNYGSLVTASTMVGGDGENFDVNSVLEAPLHRDAVYGRVSFDFTDNVTAYTEFQYADSSSRVPSNVVPSDEVTIKRDNAFLPTSIAAAMDAQHIQTFTLGRLAEDYSHHVYAPEYRTVRAVAGLDGKIGDSGWKWDAYYTHGKTSQTVDWTNRVTANFNLAIDAVIDPRTGSAVCRSTLTSPGNGCQPADLFGNGSVSQAATDYMVTSTTLGTYVTQDAAELSIQGEPFSTWAGPVSLAFGGDYRREATDVTADGTAATGGNFDANQTPWSGTVKVKEGFAEVVAPLAKDQSWAKELDLNLAARETDYDTSGSVTTWKAGATYDINESVRLRATRSRDIRAPNANELFALSAQTGHFGIIDPVTGLNQSTAVFSHGNSDLVPEKADTSTAGIVLTPSFIPRLSLSLDYYDIKVNGAIISIAPQTIVDRCYGSDPSLCNLIHRDDTGQIASIDAVPRNLQSQHVAGEDFEMAYSLPVDALFSGARGNLSFRSLITHIDSITLQDGSTYLQLAGSMEQPTVQSIGGQPHWRGNATATYTDGTTTLSSTLRYVGGGKLRDEWFAKDINVLTSASATYLDLSLQREIQSTDTANFDVFVSIVNALDRDPPITGQGSVTTRALYDVIGRTYTAGVRFKF